MITAADLHEALAAFQRSDSPEECGIDAAALPMFLMECRGQDWLEEIIYPSRPNAIPGVLGVIVGVALGATAERNRKNRNNGKGKVSE